MNALTPIVAAEPATLRTPPAAPPELWTGRPGWRASAIHIWKVGWIGAYFALLAVDGLRLVLDRRPQAWAAEGRLLAVSSVVLAGLLVLAALTRRTTRYAIGPRGVTLRYGVALPATLVIPYAAIEAVSARTHRDGAGDVAIRLRPGGSVIYPKLWPHARPWRLLRPEPMLRCVPDAGVAAALLCRALSARDRDAADGGAWDRASRL